MMEAILMQKQLTGIHHVTAITGDAQSNVDFYTGVLGLRLVKITINYDDPGSYHFYYGDASGSPGTILTFFAWNGGHPGRRGTGQVTTTAYAVPEGSLEFWQKRFEQFGVRQQPIVTRWNEQVLPFLDPDGMALELVTDRTAAAQAVWDGSPIVPDNAIRSFHSVTLSLRDATRTAELLTGTMGFQWKAQDGDRTRFVADSAEGARTVDLLTAPDVPHGKVAVGNVHHVAWRTPTDEQEQEWQRVLTEQGFGVSPVMDRQYFHSIYFREPGGVLFEIATDKPGFMTDESLEQLGTSLRLPSWLEPHREEIQRVLPPLTLPNAGKEETQ
jgi:glyoxalase family protein